MFGFGGTGTSVAAGSSSLPSNPAASGAILPVRWYYYLEKDPFRRLPDGWYEYDANINVMVEQLFQRNQTMPPSTTGGAPQKRRHVLSTVASSGFQYELDFQSMKQRNTQSGKERPIFRAAKGHPPQRVPRGVRVVAPPPVIHVSAAPTLWMSLNYVAPELLHEIKLDEANVFVDVPPPDSKPKAADKEEKKNGDSSTSYSKADYDDDCVICLDSLWSDSDRVVAIKNCSHRFHYTCIHEALTKGGGKCPLCSKSIAMEDAQTSKGKCPSATMKVRVRPFQHCRGYTHVGTIEISYRIPGGTQKSYHPQPGFSFSGTNRTAYLPDNEEGQDLLARVQFAFMHGLCFMVGTSLTTGLANTVTWASIHHKTTMAGGTYGFPDATYFDRSNDELNQLGVPDPIACRGWLQKKCPGYPT